MASTVSNETTSGNSPTANQPLTTGRANGAGAVGSQANGFRAKPNGRQQDQPAIRSRLSTLTGVQVLASGAYAPDEIVKNEDLAELGYDADWILQRTGIRERRRAAPGQATSDLAYEAAVRCLDRAGAGIDEVDLILVATMTPDTPTPSTACHLQHRLGAVAPAMDVSAACAGFMYALATGMQFIKTGCSRRALVVGADVMTRIVSPDDKKTFPLFGDGAGAVLLGAGTESQGLVSYTLGADGGGADLLYVPGGGSRRPHDQHTIRAGQQFMSMDGRAVFKWAVRLLCDTIIDVLLNARLTPGDMDLIVFHQANARIIDAAVSSLGLERDKVLVNLDRYGNTSAASMPLVLDEAEQAGKLRRGDHVLLCGFGAGLAWGAGVYRW